MLSNKLRLFLLPPLVRHQMNIARDLNNDKQSTDFKCKSPTEKTIRDRHLANITVTSFYCQSAIEQLALKVFFHFFHSQ